MTRRQKRPQVRPRHPEGSTVAEMCAEPSSNLGAAWELVAWLQAAGWRVEEEPVVTVAHVYHPTSGGHVADVTCWPTGPTEFGIAVF